VEHGKLGNHDVREATYSHGNREEGVHDGGDGEFPELEQLLDVAGSWSDEVSLKTGPVSTREEQLTGWEQRCKAQHYPFKCHSPWCLCQWV